MAPKNDEAEHMTRSSWPEVAWPEVEAPGGTSGDDTEDKALRERPTLSIRVRIILAFALFFILTMAVTLWSIWLVSDLGDRIRFLEVAGNYMMEIQQARRFEKNYLLYGTNFEDCVSHLNEAVAILSRHSMTIEKILGKKHYETMTAFVSDYRDLLTQLGATKDDERRSAIVPILRQDGAKNVLFAKDLVVSERKIVDRRIMLARRVPFFFLGGLLLLMLSVAVVLTHQLLRPLKRFMTYTERISSGDFSPIAPVRKYQDEFSKLTEAFNRMTRELDHRQQILVESHKLRAIGTLVAGVAHELNNPLNNTMLSAAVLKEDLKELPDEEKLEILDDIISETERSQRIVQNLLDFARESEARIVPVDLGRMAAESIGLVANQVRIAKIELETEFDEDLPPVHADEQMLKQVFVNLILNAVDALPPGGRIEFAIRKNRKPGYLTVEVSDDGPGIPDHIKQRIFEPFFTTKGKGRGTGLGLAVTQGIIHQLGGFITVKSKMGMGTAFIVSLPITDLPSDMMSKDS